MVYITSTDVKLFGGLADSDTYEDALLGVLIPIAQQMVDTYTERTFEYTNTSDASEARVFDAIEDVSGRTLNLDMDLHSIRSVTVDGVAFSSDSYVTEPRTSTPYFGITVLGSSSDSWDYGTDAENAISVDGHWAYSLTAPADIQVATILLVEYLMKLRNSDIALTAPIIADGITIMPSQMPAVIRTILNQYRRVFIGVV